MQTAIGDGKTYILTRTCGSYSAGTRVVLMNYTKANTAFVQVQCGNKEVLEISREDFTQLRSRVRVVKVAEENHKARYRRLHMDKYSVELTV